MSSGYKAVYEDDAITLAYDTSSSWASLPGVSASVSATNFQPVAGNSFWTIQVSNTVSAQLVGTSVQINNSNALSKGSVTAIRWSNNPLLNQPNKGTTNMFAVNSGFTGNWVTVGVLASSVTSFNIPARFVRLSGAGVSALVGNFNVAYLWADGFSNGN